MSKQEGPSPKLLACLPIEEARQQFAAWLRVCNLEIDMETLISRESYPYLGPAEEILTGRKISRSDDCFVLDYELLLNRAILSRKVIGYVEGRGIVIQAISPQL